jgi:anti-sigma factor RsiW
MISCEECGPLLMALMDNELRDTESFDVNQHLVRCSSCRAEYEELVRTDAVLNGVSFKEPGEQALEALWRSPFGRFSRWSGLCLVLAGSLGLAVYAGYEFMRDRGEPLLPKIALAAVAVGFALLLLSVIRSRVATYSTDRYKEVER